MHDACHGVGLLVVSFFGCCTLWFYVVKRRVSILIYYGQSPFPEQWEHKTSSIVIVYATHNMTTLPLTAGLSKTFLLVPASATNDGHIFSTPPTDNQGWQRQERWEIGACVGWNNNFGGKVYVLLCNSYVKFHAKVARTTINKSRREYFYTHLVLL